MELPSDFIERMRESLGANWQSFHEALQSSSPVSIRNNPHKKKHWDKTLPVPWCKTGYYLPQRPVFTLDPHLHAGTYYVQEASSMFLEVALSTSLNLSQSWRVLDLCAAPGGKSTHLLSLLSAESLLVSNEVIRSRASILSENIQKGGHANVVVTNHDPANFQRLPGFFDAIIVDAPCSGEGLFRKDPGAMKEWSLENANLCSLRQRRIMSDIWPALKENGILIYSTCTYNPEENEINLAWLKENHELEFIELSDLPNGVEKVSRKGAVGYQLMPGKVNGEGFFISVMRKLNATETIQRKVKSTFTRANAKDLQGWVGEGFQLIDHQGLIIGWPEDFTEDVEMLSQALSIVNRGVALATSKHQKLIPEHALALFHGLNKNLFPTIELTHEQALAYLRKDTLDLPGYAKGFTLMQFEGSALGWVNHLGNRVNNLYPLNWRIKMGPEGPTTSRA
jgi:16S rRNA C967 or C1407 C5-methylase (RsmB/RsmF family)/NOL1/NOP2/fmu family ribosome biogenesis protein